MSYIFGGNTGVTPEDLAYRRRAAMALLDSGTEGGSRNIYEGLGRIAKALSGSYANFKIGEEEKTNRQAASERFNALLPSAKDPPRQEQADASLNHQLRDAPQLKLSPAGNAGPSLNDLLRAYANPWMSSEQKSVLRIYIDRELQGSDPKNQLELKKLEAEVREPRLISGDSR